VREGWQGMKKALDKLFSLADSAIELGFNIFILSDRGVSHEMAPIPALLATAGLHHHLIRQKDTHPLRAHRRKRRAARGASLLAADWLRRNRGQSLHGLRNHPR
jgi:hypothetical protein